MYGTFFATIIGALVSFLGVLLTLRYNQRNFEANLREEREKAKKEREFTAKHKALVLAADSVTRFLQYYMTLPDRELPQDGTIPAEVVEMGVALNGLHFYCDIETIKHSLDMSQILSTSYATVLKTKISPIFIAEEIKVVDLQIAEIKTINSQLQQEILALLSSNPSNPLLISHRQQLAVNFHKIAEFQEKKVTLIKAKYHATEACRDVIRRNLEEVYGALRKVLLMARRELSFPIDEKQYSTILSGATEIALANIDSLYKEIRSQIAKKLGDASDF